MKFSICRTSAKGREGSPYPGASLEDKLSQEYVGTFAYEDGTRIWTINIKNLEELLKLQKEINKKIIILDQDDDWRFEKPLPLPYIEIYDDWRE